MHDYELYQLAGKFVWLFFVFAFGACAGSLINVLVYRLPRGMSVVTPPSRCPACENKLTWRENIPVLGWIILGGRCRFCKSRISAEYPLVEAFVGALLCLTFFLWYQVEPNTSLLGIHLDQIRPDWALADARDGWPRQTWPLFIMLSVLLALLVAMTLTDVKTFTIPLQLTWTTMAVGVVAHVGLAVYLSITHQTLPQVATGWAWAIPTPGGNNPTSSHAWWWIGASLGGAVGIGIGILLLELGLIRRSFADYHDWETKALAEARSLHPESATHATQPEELKPTDERRPPPRGMLSAVATFFAVLMICAGAGSPIAAWGVPRWIGWCGGAILAPVAAGLAYRRSNRRSEPSAQVITDSGDPSMWIAYPHARREMLKELVFLTPCIALGWAGGAIFSWLWSGQTPQLWLVVLAGVLMGTLIGGGLIWGVRILGTLAFGKEAMGLGDVHLMAGVGACVGWIDASLALPLAAFVGLYWTIVTSITGGGMRRTMPFGPYLAAGTVVMVFAKPLVEMGLGYVLGVECPLP